jgi:epoxyqueuosine reductase QueG
MEIDLSLTETIRMMARESGTELFGIADPEAFSDPAYLGNNPLSISDTIRSIIVIGIPVPKGAFMPLPKGRALYTNTLVAGTTTLRAMAYQIARRLEQEGFLASIAPCEGSEFGYLYANKDTLMADFSMKYAAYAAGLGSYGKNHLFISDTYGSRVRFSSVLTDAPLKTDSRADNFLHPACEGCSACIEACPVRAIGSSGTISRRLCADYMYNQLGGLRCGMCIRACPVSCRE